jgi:hypothetical protein
LVGFACHFQPGYAGANLGHPSAPVRAAGLRVFVGNAKLGACICYTRSDLSPLFVLIDSESIWELGLLLFRNSRRAFLLALGLLVLSAAVFGWGLQYKLSLYQRKDAVSHQMPEAKLLSQKERPATIQSVSNVSSERPAISLFPVLIFTFAASGLLQTARYTRVGSLEPPPCHFAPCLQAIFFRPPPALL